MAELQIFRGELRGNSVKINAGLRDKCTDWCIVGPRGWIIRPDAGNPGSVNSWRINVVFWLLDFDFKDHAVCRTGVPLVSRLRLFMFS